MLKWYRKLDMILSLSDKALNTSTNSQVSILDEVYRVSLHEETVRQELSTIDLKINRLKSLIEEASQQLQKCTYQKDKVCFFISKNFAPIC